MNKTLTKRFNTADRKAAFALTLLAMAFVVLTLTQDLLRSGFNNSAFYFSEAVIFSSFWWLFAPLFFAQYLAVTHKNKKCLEFQVAIIALPIFLHLFAFPILVFMLSAVFYYHTYTFQQTLRYTLSEHLYLLVLFYTIPFSFFQFFIKKTNPAETFPELQKDDFPNEFISTLIVSEGYKKHLVRVSEVSYFSSNSPYISIHLDGKKYLQNETLKSIATKLNPEQFVRVHKSTIVNIEMVESYATRLNGDYDLTMKDNIQLRVSRNFAPDFKTQFNKTHRLATK